jgi:malonyl-ACP decarboxylase
MREPIFITGLGVVCSIGSTIDELWRSLEAGRSGIAAPAEPGDDPSAPLGAWIPRVPFEARLAALGPLPADLADRARRTLRAPLPVQTSVVSAIQAFQAAQLDVRPLPGARIGVVVAADGATERYHHETFARHARAPDHISPRYVLHALATDHVATVSEVLGVHGEGFCVAGASASGNVAIIKAAQAIELGLVDACLVVGALCELSPVALQSLTNLGALGGKRFRDQPARACRPFDRAGEGFVYGQGSGCVVLEARRSAAARGVAGRARLLGGALVLDGNRAPRPSEAGEARAMAGCLAHAGLDPTQIDYLNAHGTSTPLGDSTEVRAIRHVLGDHAARVWINSTKPLTGHCLFSAGVIEAIACVVQLERGFVHPNLNLDDPIDPVCRFSGPRAVPAAIRVALSNSFGFGGINTCIALAGGAA